MKLWRLILIADVNVVCRLVLFLLFNLLIDLQTHRLNIIDVVNLKIHRILGKRFRPGRPTPQSILFDTRIVIEGHNNIVY